MFLLPYRLEHISSDPPCWRLNLFLSKGGQELWQTDPEDSDAPIEEIVAEYLTPNGLEGCVRGVQDGILYFEVSPSISLNSFYTIQEFFAREEVPPNDIELWRPFLWVGHAPGEQDEYEWLSAIEDIRIGANDISTIWTSVKCCNRV